MSDKKTISGKFWRWVLAALGALIIGLAGVWLKHCLGPSPVIDPCLVYTPPEENYIEEVIEQAQIESGGTESIRELIHESILVGHFILWVTECGRTQEAYEREFENLRIRVTPYSVYTDTEGRKCRELTISQRREGQWQGSTDIYCKIEGKWTPVANGN
jgi:hypothetical protein